MNRLRVVPPVVERPNSAAGTFKESERRVFSKFGLAVCLMLGGEAYRKKGLVAQAIADLEVDLRLNPNAVGNLQEEQELRQFKGQ